MTGSRFRTPLLSFLWAAALGASAATASACESKELNPEEAEATCSVPLLREPRPVRFQVHFLGSHDDTVVALGLPTLNDAPVVCSPVSKTASKYEDGEVTLDCQFIAPASNSVSAFKVCLAVHHAQLARVDLLLD